MVIIITSPLKIKKFLEKLALYKWLAKSVQLVAMAALHLLKKKIEARHLALETASLLFQGTNARIENFLEDTDSDDYEAAEDDDNEDAEDTIIPVAKKFLYIVVGSDKANCGSLRSETLLAVRRIIEKFELDSEERTSRSSINTYKLICLGIKVSNLLRVDYKRSIYSTFKRLNKEITTFFLSYVIVKSILKKSFDMCSIVFTRYINSEKQKVYEYSICSFNFFVTAIHSMPDVDSIWYILQKKAKYNPSYLSELYYFNFCLLILDSLEELEYCELQVRINSMDLLCKNVDELTLIWTNNYNKARQSSITNEILEIINAAEAIMA